MENILFWAWELFIYDEDNSEYKSLWNLNKASLNINKEIKDRIWDNKRLEPREKIKEVIFSANLYDINLTNLAFLSPNSTLTELENKKELVYFNLKKLFKFNRFKFENTDDFGRKFWFEILSWYNKAAIKAEFNEKPDEDEVVNIPIEIDCYPDENQQLIKIFDEVNN